jgi:hypothetical protein
MERYPKDIDISINDFQNSNWLAAITDSSREDYLSMWQSLSSAARQAIKDKKLEKGKVLWLLADACSMTLRPSSLNEPFKPIMVMNGKRPALPEDFQSSDIAFFAQIAEEITDNRLCARIADILWLLLEPKQPTHALLAINNYRQLPISTKAWVRDARECWDRSIQLCLMLGNGAGKQLKKEIENSLIEAIKGSTNDDGYLALWVSNLLSKYKLDHQQKGDIAEKLEQLAIEFNDSEDLHKARDYFNAAAEVFRELKNKEKHAEMIVKVAEKWEKEASDSPSNIVATSFYEKAIQKYRNIPRELRGRYDVDDRIANLHTKLNSAGEKSLEEMGEITSPAIDISKLVENARNSVKGKSAIDALNTLANVYQARVDKIRENSKEMLKGSLQSLVSGTHMSHDGRVIAKRPSADLSGNGDDEATVWPEMVKNYKLELSIAVLGSIFPALEVMRQEHRLRESDFDSVTRQSPIVPVGRERIIAKALFAGYDNDFVTALHILIPQLEHLVRFHLKQYGAKTTHLDKNGIEDEKGLSTLMEMPEIETIFGEDLSFEIKALFCDPFGPNLRNELAHGLLDYEEAQSIYSIYAWWLGLSIIFNTFWNAKHSGTDSSEPADEHEQKNA